MSSSNPVSLNPPLPPFTLFFSDPSSCLTITPCSHHESVHLPSHQQLLLIDVSDVVSDGFVHLAVVRCMSVPSQRVIWVQI